MQTIKFDMIQTMAVAMVAYYLGVLIKKKINILEKLCIPSPVVGGLLVAIANLLLRISGIVTLEFDNAFQKPFMLVFFTSIGLSASIKLLYKGGLGVVIFWLVATALCAIQDAVGIGLAKYLHQAPALGLLCGSITLTGGHGTGASWGTTLAKQYGFTKAPEIAMAAATFGLIAGSLIGGPIGRRLIQKHKLHSETQEFDYDKDVQMEKESEQINFDQMFRTLAIISVCMGLGVYIEQLIHIPFPKAVFPNYFVSMIIAIIVLNFGIATKKYEINHKCNALLGSIGLDAFLSIALIDLKLWQLKDIFGPMMIILAVQVIITGLFAYFITFNLCGRDFNAAAISAGHCGFGLGATANGVANMTSIQEVYGPAPRAFFILPIVGAFLIDISNMGIILWFANKFIL